MKPHNNKGIPKHRKGAQRHDEVELHLVEAHPPPEDPEPGQRDASSEIADAYSSTTPQAGDVELPGTAGGNVARTPESGDAHESPDIRRGDLRKRRVLRLERILKRHR